MAPAVPSAAAPSTAAATTRRRRSRADLVADADHGRAHHRERDVALHAHALALAFSTARVWPADIQALHSDSRQTGLRQAPESACGV